MIVCAGAPTTVADAVEGSRVALPAAGEGAPATCGRAVFDGGHRGRDPQLRIAGIERQI